MLFHRDQRFSLILRHRCLQARQGLGAVLLGAGCGLGQEAQHQAAFHDVIRRVGVGRDGHAKGRAGDGASIPGEGAQEVYINIVVARLRRHVAHDIGAVAIVADVHIFLWWRRQSAEASRSHFHAKLVHAANAVHAVLVLGLDDEVHGLRGRQAFEHAGPEGQRLSCVGDGEEREGQFAVGEGFLADLHAHFHLSGAIALERRRRALDLAVALHLGADLFKAVGTRKAHGGLSCHRREANAEDVQQRRARDATQGGRHALYRVRRTHHLCHVAHVQFSKPSRGPAAEEEHASRLGVVHDLRVRARRRQRAHHLRSVPVLQPRIQRHELVAVAALRVGAVGQVTSVATKHKELPVRHGEDCAGCKVPAGRAPSVSRGSRHL
eukprot:scaffold23_cov268-Pinguiococcus_pyrenoidosus.AAC.10